MLECYRVEVQEAAEKLAKEEHDDAVGDYMTWRGETRDVARETNELVAEKRKEDYDAGLRGSPRFYQSGDLVMVHDSSPKPKLDPQWRGPFRVVEKVRNSYRIKHLRHVSAYPGLFTADHLRLFYPRRLSLVREGVDPTPLEDLPPPTLRARRHRRHHG